MPYTDIAVLLVIVVGTIASLSLLWRQGRRGSALLVATWTSFYGFVLTASMAAHTAEVVYHLIRGGTTFRGAPWAYDFRSYSLLLLGGVLIWQGARCLRAAPALSRRDAEARRVALRVTGMVLVVVAPLIPIHGFFAVPLTVLSVFGLLLLVRTGRSAAAEPAAGAVGILRS